MSSYVDLIFKEQNSVKKTQKKPQNKKLVIFCFYIHPVPISSNSKENFKMHAMKVWVLEG